MGSNIFYIEVPCEMYNSIKNFLLKLKKIRKIGTKYNKITTFLLNVTFITFMIC